MTYQLVIDRDLMALVYEAVAINRRQLAADIAQGVPCETTPEDLTASLWMKVCLRKHAEEVIAGDQRTIGDVLEDYLTTEAEDSEADAASEKLRRLESAVAAGGYQLQRCQCCGVSVVGWSEGLVFCAKCKQLNRGDV